MTPTENSLHFVRRGAKSFGPFTTQQLLKGQTAGKFINTDLMSSSAAGPWHSVSAYIQSLDNRPPRSDQILAVPSVKTKGVSMTANANKMRLAAICVGGAVACLGFLVCMFVVLRFAFNSSSERADVSKLTPLVLNSEASAITPQPAATLDNQSDEGDLLATLQDLRSALEAGATPTSDEVLAPSSEQATSESELSDELRALDAEAATDLAAKFLAPSERESNGRTAYFLLSKAASMNDGRAMYLLSICYLNGIGVTKDRLIGLQWLSKSAESGDSAGMLAYSGAIAKGMYDGLGEQEAEMWLNRSASVGNHAAVNSLKQRQVLGAIGALGALASAFERADDDSQPSVHCNAGTFLGRQCTCDGFTPQLNGDRWDNYTCGDCLHDKASHNVQ